MATLTTPIYTLPYPDGAERVMDGDNAIGALATKLDGILGTLARPIAFYQASAPLTLSTTDQQISGLSLTLVTPTFEQLFILGVFDFDITTGPVFCASTLYIDGVARSGAGILSSPTAVRATVVTGWSFSTDTASHLYEVKAKKAAAAGAAVAQAVSTRIFLARFRAGGALIRDVLEELADDVDVATPS